MQKADSDVNQKWFHNMSMRYDLCEEGCHFVELMELFFHPGHNCPEKYTLVNEATRFFDFHFGFFVWFGFSPLKQLLFFSQFVSGQAGHLKVKRGSQRGFQQKLCPSGSLRIALMQGRKRSWVTYAERSKSCHMVFIGFHMVSIWVRDRSLFIPIPKFVRLSQMQGFQLFSSLENPLTRWWNTVNYSGPLWPPGHSGRFRRGLDHSDMGSASIGRARCPAVPLT